MAAARRRSAPRVGILFYRAQQTAGNTAYVHALADAVDAAGGVGLPIFAASLRDAPADLLAHLGTLDALVTTVLAAGGTRPGDRVGAARTTAPGTSQALAALDVPILQGLCLTTAARGWAESDEGMSPLDVATQVAVPEFDGRIITVPFSFKETDADGLPTTCPTSSAAAGSRRSPSTTAGCATSRRASAGSPSCCRPTPPSTPGSATPSASTPPSRSSACCGRCARRATTSARPATSPAPARWSRSRASRPTRPRATP